MRYAATLLLAITVATLHASSQPDTRPAGEGRITGRVLTESGAGIDGVEVYAFLFTDQPQAAARYSATTGPDGGYVIDRLPPGRYRVGAEKRGYSNLVVEADRMSGGRIVDLETAGTITAIDLVLRRTGSIAGRVSRPDGTPVEKARVLSQIRSADGLMLATGPGSLTDARGEYRLEDVPPGTYTITAIYSILNEMKGKRVSDEHQEWARTFHPATADFERATQITIQGGEGLENINITLQPEFLYRVSGVIVAEDASELRNARVEFTTATGMSGTVPVRDGGRFLFGNVSGAVTVLGKADTDNGPMIGMTELDVSSSVEDARVTLRAPARVRGQVIFEGTPPQDTALRVQLATAWYRFHVGNSDAAPVGADRRFNVDNLIGERRVMVRGLMPQLEVKEIRRGGRVLPEGRLTLTAGQLVDDIEIVVARRQ